MSRRQTTFSSVTKTRRWNPCRSDFSWDEALRYGWWSNQSKVLTFHSCCLPRPLLLLSLPPRLGWVAWRKLPTWCPSGSRRMWACDGMSNSSQHVASKGRNHVLQGREMCSGGNVKPKQTTARRRHGVRQKTKPTYIFVPHVVRRSHALLHGGGCKRRVPDHVSTRVHSCLRRPVEVVHAEQPALIRVDSDRLNRTGSRHMMSCDTKVGKRNASKA